MLDKVDLTNEISKEDYKKRLPKLQERLRVLQQAARDARVPTVVVLEGWDAAGKGGLVMKLVEKLDPRSFRVRPTYAPLQEELYRPWLYRFWQRLPARGEIAVFDRSWYGRVLVERVEEISDGEEVREAFSEINEFERHVVNFGTVLCKFWLHISKAEQLKRFNERGKDPYRSYQLTDDDWRNREKWGPYERAVDEMLERTSTSYAPWTIVEANDKLFARVKVLRTAVEALEKAVDGPSVAKRLRKREKKLAKLARG